MNSNMVKPEKYGHLDFVHYFTIPLSLELTEIFYKNVLFIQISCMLFSHIIQC